MMQIVINMIRTLFFVFAACVFLLPDLDAQRMSKYYLELSDKASTPYSPLRPQDFLTARAIERRQNDGIPTLMDDLPVSPQYIAQLERMGATIHHSSKWMNAVTVVCTEEQFYKLQKLPFVIRGEKSSNHSRKDLGKLENKVQKRKSDYPKSSSHYGRAANQIYMLGGQALHQFGYDGDGKLVAVLDGGFQNVDQMPFFDSLRADGRLLQGIDLVHKNDFPYNESGHGTQVLSTMAANLPGLMVGTGPAASYVCVKTEDVGSETRVEEDNWVVGLEYADSLGADVVNSSLGYTTFGIEEQNYTYDDLNGVTGRASRGADIAASKGMLIVNSAGNSGGDDWKYIGVPADAIDVFSIGAVDGRGDRTYFSSYGPTADGRIKPNVAAQGGATRVAQLGGYNTTTSSGTSFSAPVMAGMVTALWEAVPDASNYEIMRAVERSGNATENADNSLGHGMPSMPTALFDLQKANGSSDGVVIYSEDQDGKVAIVTRSQEADMTLQVRNQAGELVFEGQFPQVRSGIERMVIPDSQFWAQGAYSVTFVTQEAVFNTMIRKQKKATPQITFERP